MTSHASVAAKVRRDKEAHPENYCDDPRCLWRTRVYVASVPDGRLPYVVRPCAKHGTPARDRDFCEHCDKPLATENDRELPAGDPRTDTLCWARSEMGEICPAWQAKIDKAARDREGPEYDKYAFDNRED